MCGVKRAHVVQGDRVDCPLESVDGLPVGVSVAEQDPLRGDVHDRLGLIAPLHHPGSPIVVNALPVRIFETRADQHVGGDRHRRVERLARRLHRQLRAVAAARQPQIGAELLQVGRDGQRVARAGALIEHLGCHRRQAGAPGRIQGRAAPEHERRRDDGRHVAPQGDHLEPGRQRKARRARQEDRRQRPD
jgi:hypothetical protein